MAQNKTDRLIKSRGPRTSIKKRKKKKKEKKQLTNILSSKQDRVVLSM